MYQDFSNENCAPLTDFYNNVICIRSFSKSAGLAGLRAGYILSNQSFIDYIYRASFGVEINSIAAKAIEFLCLNPVYFQLLIDNILYSKQYLINQLRQLGFTSYDTETNFIPIKLKNKDKLITFLKEHNIRVRKYPSIQYFEDFISITVGTHDTMNHLVSVLNHFTERYELEK